MGGAPSHILANPPLVLGGSDVLEDASFFINAKLTAVVSVTDKRPSPAVVAASGLHVLHIDVDDDLRATLTNHFATTAAFIDTARKAGEGVYVHCTAGISRSTAVVAGYLILALGLSDVDALGHIQRCRDTACPNEAFREQLSQLSLQRDWPLREGSCGKNDERKIQRQRQRQQRQGQITPRSVAASNALDTEMTARDLEFIADTLHASAGAARAQEAAVWVFRSDGTYVPHELESAVFDNGDGNGPRVLVDGCARVVAHRNGDEGAALEPAAPNFALDGFSQQKRRLRQRLQPLMEAGAKPGGSVGLAWLLEGNYRTMTS